MPQTRTIFTAIFAQFQKECKFLLQADLKRTQLFDLNSEFKGLARIKNRSMKLKHWFLCLDFQNVDYPLAMM